MTHFLNFLISSEAAKDLDRDKIASLLDLALLEYCT